MLVTSIYTKHGQMQMTVKDYIFFTKHHAYRKILKYELCRVVNPGSRKVSDLNCGVQDLLLQVVDLKYEVPDLRSGGIRPNLTPHALTLHRVLSSRRTLLRRR